jgi:L-seryl-tRNA(Ser) seleniumtransferase
VRQALSADAESLRARVERLRESVGVPAESVATVAVVGGGGAPGIDLPSWALALPAEYAAPLRLGTPPVLGRVERGRLLLDLRCVPPDLDPVVAGAIRAATAGHVGDFRDLGRLPLPEQ